MRLTFKLVNWVKQDCLIQSVKGLNEAKRLTLPQERIFLPDCLWIWDRLFLHLHSNWNIGSSWVLSLLTLDQNHAFGCPEHAACGLILVGSLHSYMSQLLVISIYIYVYTYTHTQGVPFLERALTNTQHKHMPGVTQVVSSRVRIPTQVCRLTLNSCWNINSWQISRAILNSHDPRLWHSKGGNIRTLRS